MKHIFSLFIFAICIMVLCNSCTHRERKNAAILCKCFVFNMRNHDYNNCLIEVSKDSILTAYTGDISSFLYKKIDENSNMTSMRNPFLRKIRHKMTYRMTESDFIKLRHAIDNVQHLPDEYVPKFYYMTDMWNCIIVTGDNQYVFDDLTDKNEAIKKLLAVIDSLSPIHLYYRDSYPIYN